MSTCDTCYNTHNIDTGGAVIPCPDCPSVVLELRGLSKGQLEVVRALSASTVEPVVVSKSGVDIFAPSYRLIETSIAACGRRLISEARRQGLTGRQLPVLQVNNLNRKVEEAILDRTTVVPVQDLEPEHVVRLGRGEEVPVSIVWSGDDELYVIRLQGHLGHLRTVAFAYGETVPVTRRSFQHVQLLEKLANQARLDAQAR